WTNRPCPRTAHAGGRTNWKRDLDILRLETVGKRVPESWVHPGNGCVARDEAQITDWASDTPPHSVEDRINCLQGGLEPGRDGKCWRRLKAVIGIVQAPLAKLLDLFRRLPQLAAGRAVPQPVQP